MKSKNTILTEVKSTLNRYANKEKAEILKRFFKTYKGQYAEGDVFIGVTVPVIRKMASNSLDLKSEIVLSLLKSLIHEERLLALLILVLKFQKADLISKEKIYSLYLKHTKYINNWDLVDITAKHIVGSFLFDKGRKPLYTLAKSNNLWERRISIISTLYFIGRNDFTDTLKLSEILLIDKHDLIHKAVGWMLREVGKRNLAVVEEFLSEYSKIMPRTMLRYAIERFPEQKRKQWLLR
jgi:3-methyladenine DNA glycosylase AlkD